jgi:protein TonB
MAVRSHVAYPALAQRQGLSGEVLIEFTVGGSGGIGNISVLRSSNPMFESVALGAVRAFHCSGQGHPVRVRVPFTFRIDR